MPRMNADWGEVFGVLLPSAVKIHPWSPATFREGRGREAGGPNLGRLLVRWGT